MVYTGEACSHVSQSGISFHFPASESKCRVELRYKVVNDDYVLPEGYEDMPLVSSMFKITTSDELLVPVTVQMEHCAIIEEDDSLVHMIAHGPPPYYFKLLPEGKFPLGECYGEIQMKMFCTVTQAQKRRGPMSLSVHIFYHGYCSATFIATRNLRTLNRAVKKRYVDAIKVIEQSMSCDHSTEAITLKIPRPKPRGWCVQPEFEPPKIQTRLIREYREGKIPPCIHLSMTWTGEGIPVEEKVKIAVEGTSVESFFLLCRPACTSDYSLSALSLSPQRQSAPSSPQLSLISDTSRQFQTPTSLHTPFTPHLFQAPTSLHTPFTYHTDTPRLFQTPTSLHTPFTHHTGTPHQSHAPTSLHTPFTYHTDTPRQFQTPASLHTPFTHHTDTPRQSHGPTSLHTTFTYHTGTPRQFQTPASLHTPFTYHTDTPHHSPSPHTLHTDTPLAQHTDTLHTLPSQHADTPHPEPAQHTDSPAQHAADNLGLSAESRALRRSNSVFTRGVDPENLVTVLYSNFLLTPEEKARAMKQTLTIGQKLEEIFQSLERRVSTRPQDFKKIICALIAEPALKAVGDRMQGEF